MPIRPLGPLLSRWIQKAAQGCSRCRELAQVLQLCLQSLQRKHSAGPSWLLQLQLHMWLWSLQQLYDLLNRWKPTLWVQWARLSGHYKVVEIRARRHIGELFRGELEHCVNRHVLCLIKRTDQSSSLSLKYQQLLKSLAGKLLPLQEDDTEQRAHRHRLHELHSVSEFHLPLMHPESQKPSTKNLLRLHNHCYKCICFADQQ